jgi:hypothetical protein
MDFARGVAATAALLLAALAAGAGDLGSPGQPVLVGPVPDMEVLDVGDCTPAGLLSRLSGNEAKQAVSLSEDAIAWIYSVQGSPAKIEVGWRDAAGCRGPVRLDRLLSGGDSSHDAPSLGLFGGGRLVAAYHAAVNGGSRLRISQPGDPSRWGPEFSERCAQTAEILLVTLPTGRVLVVCHNLTTAIDLLNPDGSWAWPSPRGLLFNGGASVSPICPWDRSSRFTKTHVHAFDPGPGGQPALIAVWGVGGPAGANCPDIQPYQDDSREVYAAISFDHGLTWQNLAGTTRAVATPCQIGSAPYCSLTGAIEVGDPAYRLGSTRQRQYRGIDFDPASGWIHVTFDKSLFCDAGPCWSCDANGSAPGRDPLRDPACVQEPGGLRILRTRYGSGTVEEFAIDAGEHTYTDVVRVAPGGRLLVYSTKGGRLFEYTAHDAAGPWTERPVLADDGQPVSGRCHGTGRSLLAPRAVLLACGVGGDTLRIVRRTLPP